MDDDEKLEREIARADARATTEVDPRGESVEHVSTKQLRKAAAMWRSVDTNNRAPHGVMSLHDRIDELIDEVERLRNRGEGLPDADKS